MSAPAAAFSKRGLLIKLAVVGVVLGLTALLLLRGVNIKELLNQTLAWIRSVGPTAFFCGMAVLPAIGFPLLAFSLSAGPVFVPQLGLPTVILLVTLSLTANLALTYWLARYAFRPILEKLIVRLGYSLPQVAEQDQLGLTILVRVTPGPPFFVQGYLLGLAGVPFKIYMLISLLIAGSQAVAIVIFGESLVNGRGKIAFFAFGLIVAFSVLVQWLRRRYARKKVSAA